MTHDDDGIDLAALREMFLLETGELLSALEAAALAIEAHPDDRNLVETMFRAAHTIKGNARVVGLDQVAEFLHGFEDLLDEVRGGHVAPSRALTTLILKTVDVLRIAAPAAVAGETAFGADAEALKGEFARANPLARGTGDAGEAVPAAGETAPANPREGDPEDGSKRQPVHGKTIRVSIDKLDRLMDLAAEVAIARGRLTELLESETGFDRQEALEVHRESDTLSLGLQELVMKMRMIPLGPLFHEFQRIVRDLSLACGKSVRLEIAGEDVEVDARVVEHLRDPILHLIRNALHHGIEAPDIRVGAGKPATGTVALKASRSAGSVILQMEDDGAGLDRMRLLEKARANGLVGREAHLPDADLARLVFEPGFSTAEEVTEISGRGVGMDVVRRNIEQLRGTVGIESVWGRGTTVTLRVPLTLAIISGFRVVAGGETYVVPMDCVVECLNLPVDERAEGTWGVASVRDKPMPYLNLKRAFGLEGPATARENLLVIRHNDMDAGLAVDSLVGDAQTVIKPLAKLFQGIPGLAGTAIMGNGRVAFVLDVPGLLDEALKRSAEAAGEH
jgi:two-component system, chemotaxis family, sensor kinase CheA